MSPQLLTSTSAIALEKGEAARLLADDPWWIMVIKVVGLFLFGLLMTIFMIVWERKVVGRMQHRPGPNRVGPGGWLQSVADALKLALKEDIRPVGADKWVYFIAPIISATPAFIAFSVIPFAPRVSIFGEETVLQLVDLPVGLLVLLACSSLGVYGIVLAGWSSGSPYPLLGGLRSAAQVISYEIAMGLSLVAVILFTGSMSTSDMVSAQASGWYVWLLPVSFVVYVISMVGETNRAPFDLPEAESELVGGFHTEYSSLKFAMFFLAEYVNMVVLSCLATTLFLGGWMAPWPISLWADANLGWWPVLWFIAKTLLFLFMFIWLRGTLPRMRYDQFMRLGWKVLIPLSLVWIVLVFTVRAFRTTQGLDSSQILLFGGIVLVVLILLTLLIPDRKTQDEDEVTITGGGYPVPPLDLVVPETPKRKKKPSPGTRRPVASAGASRSLGDGGSEGEQ